MSYDEAYAKTKDYFGDQPEQILVKHYGRIEKSLPVLDIGAGQGRNTFFLSRNGLEVDAIDPSKAAIDAIQKVVDDEKLPVRTRQCGFDTFAPPVENYSGILIFGLIQILSRKAVDSLITRIERWTRSGSLIFITGFTVADPVFVRHKQTWESIGDNSFADDQGNIRSYLEANEIKELFPDYRPLYHWEGFGPEHRHGDEISHCHAKVEAVFMR